MQGRQDWLVRTLAGVCIYRVRKHVLLDPANYKITCNCNRRFHTHANSFGYDGRRSRNSILMQQRRTAYPRKKVRRGHERGPWLVNVWFYTLGSVYEKKRIKRETHDYYCYFHFGDVWKSALCQSSPCQ